MYAILLSTRNLAAITYHCPDIEDAYPIDYYLNMLAEWYVVSSYVTRGGQVIEYVILPKSAMNRYFTYDKEKIYTEWTHIER